MHNILKLILILFIVPSFVMAQSPIDFNKKPDDDLGNFEDEFQESFYEALKQKGIENYTRAVDALQKCLTLDDTKPVIYYELGKNYNLLKNFGAAEEALKKAISMQPDNEWFLDELYDVYNKQGDINKAIKTIKQLVKYHPDYKQDLAVLYVKEKKYRKALELLDELDAEFGITDSRKVMRNDIYNASGNSDDRIAYLQEQVYKMPNNEDNYLQLIYRYSESGDKKNAYATAQTLLNIKPDSELVHLALYKFYLDDAKIDDAILSVKKVVSSTQINEQAKTKVLKDFVAFVGKNPQYESVLVDITTLAASDESAETQSNLGEYYLKSGDKQKALRNFQKALKQNPNDFKLIRDVLLLQLDLQDFETVITDSQKALELYPAQPILYLVNGVANSKIQNYEAAIENLEMGLDFLIDNPTMEADFYSELSVAYKGINNITKSQSFAKKAQVIKGQQ